MIAGFRTTGSSTSIAARSSSDRGNHVRGTGMDRRSARPYTSRLSQACRIEASPGVGTRNSCWSTSRFAAMPATFSSRVGYSTHPDRPSLPRASASASSRACSVRRSGTRMASWTNRDARAMEISSSMTHTGMPCLSEAARDTQALAAAADHHRAHVSGRPGLDRPAARPAMCWRSRRLSRSGRHGRPARPPRRAGTGRRWPAPARGRCTSRRTRSA